jgi:hypothetical protein
MNMATYCIEKFESGVQEKKVYWDCAKHRHDANMISEIARRLGNTYGGTWTVRSKSYQSNQSRVPDDAVALGDLHA